MNFFTENARLVKKSDVVFKSIENTPKALLFIMLLLFFGCTPEKDNVPEFHIPIKKIKNSNTDNSPNLFKLLRGEDAGIDFVNSVNASSKYWDYTNYYNGAGVGVGDFNNDKLPDLYFSANKKSNKLYINKGKMRFEDQTKAYGLDAFDGEWTTGVTIVDINKDGFMDIYVSCSNNEENEDLRANKLYINHEGKKFYEVAAEYGIDDKGFTTHAAFLDYDLDGDLDLYVLNHPIDFHDRRKINNHEKVELGVNESDKFYVNNGDRTFTDVSKDAGINNHGFGLSVNVCDFNDDGYPDIFTTNDWGLYDQYFINQQDGSFSDLSLESFPKQSFSSMGCVINDFNNDGYPDIFVSEMEAEDHATHRSYGHNVPKLAFQRKLKNAQYHDQYFRNALHLNNGDGTYREIARAANVDASDWSWASILADFDNDGWKDLFVTNGFGYRTELDQRSIISKLRSRHRRKETGVMEKFVSNNPKAVFKNVNRFYQNNKDLSFSDVTSSWAEINESLSYGAGIADFDNDGDLDIVTSNMNESVFLYQNMSVQEENGNNFLRVHLMDSTNTTKEVNIKVTIYMDDLLQTHYIETTKGYLSSSEKVAHFGLGKNEKVDKIYVHWNDGEKEIFHTKDINTNIYLTKGQGKPFQNLGKNKETEIVEELHFDLKFSHKENRFDDFKKDALKPRYHSTIGPSIAVGDITGDGVEDFYISGAKGQNGNFFTFRNNILEKVGNINVDPNIEEQGVLLFDVENDGDNDLFIASGNIELNEGDKKLQDLLFINDGSGNFSLDSEAIPSTVRSVTSTVVASDIDQDGDLDLFLGSRYKKANYPLSGRHFLLINENGKFKDGTSDWKLDLSDIGMLSSALWSDYNNDGLQDLITVGEWSDISIFENRGDNFVNVSAGLGLSNTGGWWNSVVGADLDKDGDTDYILGNAGINMKYVPENDYPVRVYYGLFDNDKELDFMLSYYFEDKEYPIHLLEDFGKKFKMFKKRFNSYNKFALTNATDFFNSEKLESLSKKDAYTFKSIILWNESNKFRIQELPFEAQASTVNGILVYDYDNDSHLDILLQGNLFDWLPQYEKQDGIMGLLLKGDGNGNFEVRNYVDTGFEVKGENRALVRLSTESENYILNGVNNKPLKIFSLQKSDMVSVSLLPNECLALITGLDGKTERREVYYGEGYLSQSSRTIALDMENIKGLKFVSYSGKERIIK